MSSRHKEFLDLSDEEDVSIQPAKKLRTDEQVQNSWRCLICTFDNGLHNLNCEMCNSERVNSMSVFEKVGSDRNNFEKESFVEGKSSSSNSEQTKKHDETTNWLCKVCTFNNKTQNSNCEMCDGTRPNQPSEKEKSNFESSITSGPLPIIQTINSSSSSNASTPPTTIILASNLSGSSSHASKPTGSEVENDKILPSIEHTILTGAECNQARNTANSSSWIVYNDIMYKFNPTVHRDSLSMVMFDMDGNIIETKSGKKFATNENDWKLWDAGIPAKLQKLHSEGVYLAMVSNQNGIKKGQTTARAVQSKVDAIIAHLGVPMDFICSTEDDKFRKPRPGMLEFLVLARCPNALKSKSMYVGDAAGREKEGPRGKDFSDSDLKAALNLGIPFQTPEVFFRNSTQRLHTNIKVASGVRLSEQPFHPAPDPVIFTIAPGGDKKQDLVLLVAPPASGKTTLCQKFVDNGYVRVNQDTLKTVDKCLAASRKYLQQGQSVCVDNTNMDPKVRAKWIDLGKELGVSTRCVVLRTPKEVTRSLAMFRMLDPFTAEEDRRHISSIVVNMFFKEPMNWPSVREGFSRVDSIDWSPAMPKAIKSLRLFRMYLK